MTRQSFSALCGSIVQFNKIGEVRALGHRSTCPPLPIQPPQTIFTAIDSLLAREPQCTLMYKRSKLLQKRGT